MYSLHREIRMWFSVVAVHLKYFSDCGRSWLITKSGNVLVHLICLVMYVISAKYSAVMVRCGVYGRFCLMNFIISMISFAVMKLG